MRDNLEAPLFNHLIAQYHPLGYTQLVGEHLKYLVYAAGRPIACLAWSSAPRHLSARDRYIGWTPEARRRNLCGDVFEAEAPEGVGEKKYDETAAAMVALLRYGSGVPFYRLEGLEASLGIPLPSSTQWEIVAETAMGIHPAFDELIRQAAQGEVFYNDDTSMKILALAAGPLGQVSHGHAGDPAGTGISGGRFRIVDGGTGSDNASRSGDGRFAGSLCGV